MQLIKRETEKEKSEEERERERDRDRRTEGPREMMSVEHSNMSDKTIACDSRSVFCLCSHHPCLTQVRSLNADPTIHGVLVQLPLPAHVNEVPIANLHSKL